MAASITVVEAGADVPELPAQEPVAEPEAEPTEAVAAEPTAEPAEPEATAGEFFIRANAAKRLAVSDDFALFNFQPGELGVSGRG